MAKIQERNKNLWKEIKSNTLKKYELESNIYQLNEKIKKNIYELGIHSTLSATWIKKSDQIALLHKKVQNVTSEKEFNEIRKKIKKLDNEMKKIWDGKKIEKIFEEILPINDRLYLITTFQHTDNSITEIIMHLQQLTNGEIQVINQIKTFANINEYKKILY